MNEYKKLDEIPREKRTIVLDRDWDVLLVLDACRYDTFLDASEDFNFPNNSVEKIYSVGTWTGRWMKETFVEDNYKDIVYISANPQTEKIKDKFYKHIPLYDKKWHGEYGTVLPEEVSKETIEQNALYPNKKIIAHYLQPHSPFIGEHKLYTEENTWDWNLCEAREGSISMEDFYTYYEENLKRVLTSIEKIIPYLTGKVAITSDHGYLFGEYVGKDGNYLIAHPKEGDNIPELVEVPWCAFNAGPVQEGKPKFSIGKDKYKKAEVKEKLKALGY